MSSSPMALGMPSSSSCREISIACDVFFKGKKQMSTKLQVRTVSTQHVIFCWAEDVSIFGGDVVIANTRCSISCFIKTLTYSETMWNYIPHKPSYVYQFSYRLGAHPVTMGPVNSGRSWFVTQGLTVPVFWAVAIHSTHYRRLTDSADDRLYQCQTTHQCVMYI